MTSPVAQCVCSHTEDDHANGSCEEPTGRCSCPQYIELCPKCQHSEASHNGPSGRCTRTIKKTQQPCGCSNYPVEEGS